MKAAGEEKPLKDAQRWFPILDMRCLRDPGKEATFLTSDRVGLNFVLYPGDAQTLLI